MITNTTTKDDFKSKQFSEIKEIIDIELENGLKRELETYYPKDEMINIELLNTTHIPLNSNVRERIKERLVNVHGFDWDDLYALYKTGDTEGNIIVRVYVI